MTNFVIAFETGNIPIPADREQAAVGFKRWREAAEKSGDSQLPEAVDAAIADPCARRLLEAVFGGSTFLTSVIEREPAFTVALLQNGAEQAGRQIMEAVAEAAAAALAGSDPSRDLRIAKRRLALTTALADITRTWDLEKVTGALSELAEAALDCALGYLLVDAARRGVLKLADPSRPQQRSGLIILGLGKLGARELNYSSDIDIIVFYDSEQIVTDDADRLQHHMVRLTHNLVRIMEQRTADGYVFRTDLRLRPDPASTPPAMSVLAAETYYEALGQNWERAAFIKARPVAGDRKAGEALLRRLVPFVWRRNLDFAAIRDVHSIKRQINAHRGGGRIAVAGHNIKLGRGGIREIEFFAQTQQLIWGGRVPELRAIGTIDALRALARHGKISSEVASELIDAYTFLRRLEHRLQMINDEQTHTLPDSDAGLRALALFFGYPDRPAFEADLLHHLCTVESHYADLFETEPALTAAGGGVSGNLVFTGGEADPETLSTLTALGFANPRAVDAVIRGWHHGRYRAMRSKRARELLTELVPVLLRTFADTPDPDAALLAFDRFLSGLPAGVQLFSMFHAYPHLLGLVSEIIGVAPRVAEHLTRHPSMLEAVLTADFFEPPPDCERLAAELNEMLARAADFQDVLDISRRWAHERRFQVGVQSLRGRLDAAATGEALSNIAEVAVRVLYPRVRAEFAAAHGSITRCEMAIIAMGKLGGREMTASSDLDLIFVYTTPREQALSDGPRPLPASQYFARLSQRLINALTAPTAEGRLYDVDMRLRPSGKAGPIAVSFESFRRYQLSEAWTWERMALTRARLIAGPRALCDDIAAAIRTVLTRQRDAAALLADVAEMRARIDAEHHTASIWDVKYQRGGLVDIEFIAQYLQLRDAHAHPEILSPNTGQALRRIGAAGLLPPGVAEELLAALALWQAVQGRLRMGLSDAVAATGVADASPALRRVLDGVAGLPFEQLAERIINTAAAVYAHFQELIERPAAALAARKGGAG